MPGVACVCQAGDLNTGGLTSAMVVCLPGATPHWTRSLCRYGFHWNAWAQSCSPNPVRSGISYAA